MRRRVDMTEVETATKIRAKYLRALENEEWDLLPGPTFVKTFLRTYAEYLGLDARLLVEEYRQRYERPSTHDMTPFPAGLGRQARRRRSPLGAMGPGAVVLVCVALLLGALYGLGTLGDDADEETPAGSPAPPEASPTASEERERERREPRPERVRLRLVATAPVYVCVVDATGRQVVDEEVLAAGTRTRTFSSRSFTTNFGNGNVRMRVNGRTYRVAQSSEPIGYRLRPGRRPSRLDDGERPDCSA